VDNESILDLTLAEFRPSRSLRWHYRSRHESLIAFSNRHFYNDPIVFPSIRTATREIRSPGFTITLWRVGTTSRQYRGSPKRGEGSDRLSVHARTNLGSR
jgi:superfamily I DNA and/or RNA helicase